MQTCIALTRVVMGVVEEARDAEGWTVEKTDETVIITDEYGALVYKALKKSESTWIVRYSTEHFEMFDPPELMNK